MNAARHTRISRRRGPLAAALLMLAALAFAAVVGELGAARAGGLAGPLREVKIPWQIVVEEAPAPTQGCSAVAFLQISEVKGAVSYAVTIVDSATGTYNLTGPPWPADSTAIHDKVVRPPKGSHRWGLSSAGTSGTEGCGAIKAGFLNAKRWKVTKAVALVAGNAGAPTAAIVVPVSKELGPNDTGKAVEKLQAVLKKQGLYKGPIDGVYGSHVVAAVIRFQKANGLVQDGIVGPNTAAKMNASAFGGVDGGGSGSGGNIVPPVSKSVRPNDAGKSAENVQVALKKLGLYKGPIDGIYGKDVVAAVIKFQKAKGFVGDGVVGSDTAAAINKAAANAKSSAIGGVDGGGSGSGSGGNIVVPVSKSIRANDTGDAVERVQLALKKLGLYKGPIDAVFGKDVVAAVTAFQKANGFVGDGVVGPATAAKINKAASK